jgi:hypothetical protein
VSISSQAGEPLTLGVFDEQGQLGTIRLDTDRLTGSSESSQAIADSALRRAGGDAEIAFESLDGWSNGYVWVHP